MIQCIIDMKRKTHYTTGFRFFKKGYVFSTPCGIVSFSGKRYHHATVDTSHVTCKKCLSYIKKKYGKLWTENANTSQRTVQ